MRARVILLAGSLLLSLAMLGLSNTRQKPNARPSPSPKDAQLTTLPRSVLDAQLKAVHGGSIFLSNYSGKTLVLNLWATWCAPCRTQMSSLVELHRELQSHGIEVVALSTEDPEDSAEAVREFVQDFEVPFTVGWSSSEVTVSLMQGRDSIPQTYVISRSGRVVKRLVGFNPKMTPKQLRQAIKEALNEKPYPPEQN